MPDQRETIDDLEEAVRSAWAGIRSHMFTSLPAIVAQDSDGHTMQLQVAIKRATLDPTLNAVSYEDYPVLTDVPVHHPGAGGVTHTFPIRKGDEILANFAALAIDAWHQSGGVQQPIFDRLHHLSDAMGVPGWRSDPRKLQQMSTSTAQHRSDDKKHVDELDPASGFHRKTVDPSTPAASTTFDPFKQAKTFYEHRLHGTNGVIHNATDNGTTHTHSLTHALGHILSVVNGLHSVLAHPQNGASLNANNLLHQVLAHPSLGALLSAANGAHKVHADPNAGVTITSSIAHAIDAPSTSVSGEMSVSGGLSGQGASFESLSVAGLPVTGGGLGSGSPATGLPIAANDVAAAAAGVAVRGFYIDTAAVSGHNLLAVRMS